MNIDIFRVKELENFTLPLKEIAVVFNVWPSVVSVVPLTLEFAGSDIGAVNGTVETTKTISGVVALLTVTNIFLRGANSGAAYEGFLDLLRESYSGRLVAYLVWDAGEKIVRLTVDEGTVTEDVIDV